MRIIIKRPELGFMPTIIMAMIVTADIMTGGINLFAQTVDCRSSQDCFNKGHETDMRELKITYFTRAIEEWKVGDGYENLATIYDNRGNASRDLKQYEKAIADYTKAIELYPKGVLAYSLRGILYGQLGKYNKAIEDFDRVIELNPKFAVAYKGRGSVYLILGRVKKGKADLQKAAAEYSMQINSRAATAGYYSARGWTYLWLGKCESAKSDFEKGIERDEKNPALYDALGVYWWACRKNKKDSLKWFEKSFQRGFDRWEEYYQETSDGHFLRGLNDSL